VPTPPPWILHARQRARPSSCSTLSKSQASKSFRGSLPCRSSGTVSVRDLRPLASPTTNPDQIAESMVVAAQVDSGRLEEIKAAPGIKVYPNSELNLFQSGGWVDVSPFPYRPAVPIGTIRALLGTGSVWRDGFYGQNIIVGIVDEGINGIIYPGCN
jgi:hypothetical protein